MRHYKSEFKLDGEPIEIFYDTINNEVIAIEDYPCLYKLKGWSLKIEKIKSYFVASDEEGLGIRTEFKDKKFTTYYEDEEWCEMFSLLEDLEYYDSFSKNERIRMTISYNILMINQELNGVTILDKIFNIRLRNSEKDLVGIAVQGDLICRNNSVYLIMNRLITNNLNTLDFSYATIYNDDEDEEIILSSSREVKDFTNGYTVVTLNLDRRFSDSTHLSVIQIDGISDPEWSGNFEDELDDLNLSYKEICLLADNGKIEMIEERKKALAIFNKLYHIFDREIDIANYLLS